MMGESGVHCGDVHCRSQQQPPLQLPLPPTSQPIQITFINFAEIDDITAAVAIAVK